jgi:hypothetical protein
MRNCAVDMLLCVNQPPVVSSIFEMTSMQHCRVGVRGTRVHEMISRKQFALFAAFLVGGDFFCSMHRTSLFKIPHENQTCVD